MTLIAALRYLGVVLVLACLAIALGTRVLRWLGMSAAGRLEEALYAAGLFFIGLEVSLFVLATFGWLRQGIVLAVLGAAGLVAGKQWLELPNLAMAFAGEVRRVGRSVLTVLIVGVVLICLTVDALMAMAPLTGSDALHYHFTVPMLEAGQAWQPIFWLANSFFVGQGHMLISLGFALGSDHISLGLIYLGGVLTVAALFVLVRKLVPSGHWPWLAVLVFLVTPMVYWQMSTSGSPDIWMAFYSTLVVLAAGRGVETGRRDWWCLAGVFAGAVAGAKYTGWVIPLALVACCLLSLRSWKCAAFCGLWTLPAGILPLARNAVWTADPFFPFLTRWLFPAKANAYALGAVVADMHAPGFNRGVAGIFQYPFALALNGDAYGFGQYFGPLILSLAPAAILALRPGFLARAAAGLWAAVLLSNALTCQQGRFLLPVFPLALALVLAGTKESFERGWNIVRFACVGTLLLFVLFGLASEALYARDFLPVVVGLEKQGVFLERMAPDYAATAFINRALPARGKVMVFFRHLYYLRPPFMEGRPETSWPMDPNLVREPHELVKLLHREDVRWVAKVPNFPEPLTAAFEKLVTEGELRPVVSTNVSTFTAFRMYGRRATVPVVILEVKQSDSSGALAGAESHTKDAGSRLSQAHGGAYQ